MVFVDGQQVAQTGTLIRVTGTLTTNEQGKVQADESV